MEQTAKPFAIQSKSLSQTVDAWNSALFDGQRISAAQRSDLARWIASRQGLPGAYARTFAGFPEEMRTGIQVFTGERMTSASARHILGEEALRALRQLKVRDASVNAAIRGAAQGLGEAIERAHADPRNTNPGLFCCGKCTVSMWRQLVVGGLDRQEERLDRGLAHLRRVRKDGLEWARFPFWYTVLALQEIESKKARTELRHAAPRLERAAARQPGKSPYAHRRHELARRALARIG